MSGIPPRIRAVACPARSRRIVKVVHSCVEANAEACGAGKCLDNNVQCLPAIGVIAHVVLFHAERPRFLVWTATLPIQKSGDCQVADS